MTADRVDVMGALELVLDVAYHDGTPRELAVAAEAWTLAGYHDGSIDVAHAAPAELARRVANSRYGRPKRLLRADARGLLYGVQVFAEAGLLQWSFTSEARRERWLARGGNLYGVAVDEGELA